MGYSRAGTASRYPLDQALALPAPSFSYATAALTKRRRRMERSGMRWAEEMARAIVQLRAI